MAFQIFNDGAVIRIENGTKTLLLSKEQVKTIDTIQNNIVRVDIGEGPLKNIFINYQDVAAPVVASANDLRDVIKSWLVSDNFNGGDATEETQLNILTKLGDLALLLQGIKDKQKSLTEGVPTRTDESNSYMVYNGWHIQSGNPEAAEWAIERVRREGDEVIHEWAFGTQDAIYKWVERGAQTYAPLNHGSR